MSVNKFGVECLETVCLSADLRKASCSWKSGAHTNGLRTHPRKQWSWWRAQLANVTLVWDLFEPSNVFANVRHVSNSSTPILNCYVGASAH